MIEKRRCNRCYKRGETVWMEHVGDTKPRSPTSKGVRIEPMTGRIIGKPKWKCPNVDIHKIHMDARELI